MPCCVLIHGYAYCSLKLWRGVIDLCGCVDAGRWRGYCPIEGVHPSLTVTPWKIRRTRKVLKPLEPESASAEGLHVLRHKVVPDPADLYNHRLILHKD